MNPTLVSGARRKELESRGERKLFVNTLAEGA